MIKKHAFFIKLFVSFTLIIVILISIIYGISYRAMLVNSETEIGKSSINNLQMADTTMQQLNDSLYKDCVNLSLNKPVVNMINYLGDADITTPDEIVNIMQILDLLSNLVRTNSIYDSIYLYLNEFPYIFTSSNGLVSIENFKDDEWMKYLNQYYQEKYPISFVNTRAISKSEYNLTKNGEFVTTYIYPFNPYTSSLDGAIIINISESTINKMINGNAGGSERSVFIMNKGGEVISNSDTSMLCKNISSESYIKTILKDSSQSGYFFHEEDSVRMLISFYKSDFNDWIYVSKFPIGVLTQSQNRIRNSSLLLALLIMVLGVGIVFIVSRRIYKPIDTVVKTIKSGKWVSLQDDEDEMSIIYKVLNTIDRNSDEISSNQNRKKLQKNAIIKLLGGDLLDQDEKNILADVFPYNNYFCAIMSLRKYDDKQWGYIKAFLLELSEETLGEAYHCIGCTIRKGEIVILFNIDWQQFDEEMEKVRQKFLIIKSEVAKVLDSVMLTVGIGDWHSDISGVYDSYLEAQAALRQKIKRGLDQIIVWDKEFAVSTYYYPLKAEEHIFNYMSTCRKDELLVEVSEMIEDLKGRVTLSCENINQIIVQLVGNTIIKYIIENGIDINEVYGVDLNIYHELSCKETLDEIKEFIIEKYTILLDYISSQRDQKKTVDKIVEYIHDNYKRDIGISDIAEFVGLSYSHVRKIFKAEKGINITDYINNLRIKEAKILLLNKKLSMKNIAELIGYNNDQSFERYFKKVMGITPGEFRSQKLGGL